MDVTIIPYDMNDVHTYTVFTVDFCVYKGKTYTKGQQLRNGCDYHILRYEWCSHLHCLHCSSTYSAFTIDVNTCSVSTVDFCVYKGKTYTKGQQLRNGCDYNVLL